MFLSADWEFWMHPTFFWDAQCKDRLHILHNGLHCIVELTSSVNCYCTPLLGVEMNNVLALNALFQTLKQCSQEDSWLTLTIQLGKHLWHTFSSRLAPSTSHSSSALSDSFTSSNLCLVGLPRQIFLMPWTCTVCQGPFAHTTCPNILPSSSFPNALNMAFAGFPSLAPLQTILIHLIFSLCPEHGVCQGSLRSHHMSKPSYLLLIFSQCPEHGVCQGCLASPHLQTILPSSGIFPMPWTWR